MEWGSFILGAVIGAFVSAIATKTVDLIWGKSERWIYKRRNTTLPWMGPGYIAGIKKKDFRNRR